MSDFGSCWFMRIVFAWGSPIPNPTKVSGRCEADSHENNEIWAGGSKSSMRIMMDLE